jgi:hypothetical protein
MPSAHVPRSGSISYGAGHPLDQIRAGLVHCRNELFLLFQRCILKGCAAEKPILLPHVMVDELHGICDEVGNPALKSSELACLLKSVQEAIVLAPRLAFALRPNVGEWHYIRCAARRSRQACPLRGGVPWLSE